MSKKKILVFTGAGVSAESGIKTFRDEGGLWDSHKVEDVASIEGWNRNPKLVLDFYNKRRREFTGQVSPNQSHILLAEMEKDFDVTIVTQNVDNLHEQAGSTKVIHLHGEFVNMYGKNKNIKFPYNKDIEIGDLCPEGGQLRPDIVWFGEELDFLKMDEVKSVASESDICIIIGTSMCVYPAAGIPWLTKETSLIYYVDPGNIDFLVPKFRKYFFYHFQKLASDGVKEVYDELIRLFNK